MSSQSPGGRNRQDQGSEWDPGIASVHQEEENKQDHTTTRIQISQFSPASQLPRQQAIQGGIRSPHSRLAGYAGSTSNPMPQSYQDAGNLQFLPIQQSHMEQFHPLQFQSSHQMPPYTSVARDQAISPWGQSISPQFSWQSNATASSLSQTSTPHQTPRWDMHNHSPMQNPNVRQQSAFNWGFQTMPRTTQLISESSSLDNPRGRTLAYDPLRQPSRSHELFSSGELAPSPTHDAVIEKSASRGTSPMSSGVKSPTPLPQNLRGDPFRSAKVKTELCRHYRSRKGCIFGDKCNYAHGEHELKFNKLMDLERERLIDIEVFRTHPCFSWIATGACPFDQRCTRLHDPRMNGLQPSWLPHAEVMITHVGRGLNVDKMYHQQYSGVYSCSPVYGFAPENRWQSDEQSTRDSWNEFYSFCCSMESSQLGTRNGLWPVRKSNKESVILAVRNPINDLPEISEMHRVEIALLMRGKRKAQYFTFIPSHLFCGELCMILQTSYFRLEVVESFQDIKRYSVIPLDEEEASTSSNAKNPMVITAREIAFGPVADASVRPVSVWFNIPEEDITPCTRQQARRHKRSRHRLRQKRDHEKLAEELKIVSSCSIPPFNSCQPVDEAAFDLVTNIMKHRLLVLKYFSSSSNQQGLRMLATEEESLLKCFESQRRFWVTWTWPKRTGSNYIDNNTDVPDIDGAYSFVTYGNRAYGEDAIFFGVDQPPRYRGLHPVISKNAKLATGLVWKSFAMNLQLISDRGAVEVPAGEEQMPDHDPIVSQMPRLKVFRNLSLGRSAVRNSIRTPPSIQAESCSLISVSTSLDAVLHEWTSLQHEYEENSSNPLKDSQMDKDKPPDPNLRRSLSYSYDEAAKLMIRCMPTYSD